MDAMTVNSNEFAVVSDAVPKISLQVVADCKSCESLLVSIVV